MTWQQKTTNNGRDCEHGHAHYKCPICERDEEIHNLREVALAAKELLEAEDNYDPAKAERRKDPYVARAALRAKLKEIGL